MDITEPNDEAEIRELIADWNRALWVKDLDRLTSFYTEDAVVFDFKPPLRLVGPAALRKMWADVFPLLPPSFQMELRDLVVFVKGDTAFAYWFMRLMGPPDSFAAMMPWIRGTGGYVKIDGLWRIAHEHISIPFDPETLTVSFTSEL